MAEPGKQSTTFVELMEKQPLYGPLMDKSVKYKLIAVHNGTYWSLAIKGETDQPDQDLPYVTIELISDDGINVVRAVRKVDYEEDELLRLLKAKDVGTYGPEKLRDLCKAADDTFQGIVKWHEFCPQLVNRLGFQVDFVKTTSRYYTIEVFEGNGYKKCYLGTQNNGMWYGPTFPFGNLAGKQKINTLMFSEEIFGEGRGVGIILTRIMATLLYNSGCMAIIIKSCLNLTVHWNCNPNEKSSKVINMVTEMSPDRTFMQLGPQISSRPQTYQVTLSVGQCT